MNPTETPQSAPARMPGEQMERLMIRGLLIFFAAIVVYIPAMSGGFIYDDDLLLTQNPLITSGTGFTDAESWKALGKMWFPVGVREVNDYAPLASTTLWVEWRLWGDNEKSAPESVHGLGAAGYHITNILLHAAGALLLWAVLARMGIPGGWVAALLWAVHPVCAESVAWIAERRNTLSMPVLMLAMLAWLQFQEKRSWRDYGLALVFFTLALLSKTSVVMLPVFFLLWIWWRRGAVTGKDAMESVPFFMLSLLLGLVTVFFQQRAIAGEKVTADLFTRLINASFALGFYAYKALLPFNLVFNYPEWHHTVPVWLQLLPALLFGAAFFYSLRNHSSWGRHVIPGLGFFVVMIVPALGIQKMAYMRISLLADHFEYMPMAGLIALAVAGAAAWMERAQSPSARHAGVAAAACVALLFSALTFIRAIVFQEPESLWVDTLAKNPDAWQAHEHLGGILSDRGDLEGALAHFKRGVELRPDFGEVHNNYGNTLRAAGRVNEAVEENCRGAELSPDNLNIVSSYADTLMIAGRDAEAAKVYKQALQLNEANPLVYNCLGVLSLHARKYGEAAGYFQKALGYAPNFPAAEQNLELARRREAEQKP